MPSNVIGQERSRGIYRVIGVIVYAVLVGWIIAGIAGILAILYAIGDWLMSIILGRNLEFGRSWAQSVFYWNVNLLLWMLFNEEWPGWMGWTPGSGGGAL